MRVHLKGQNVGPDDLARVQRDAWDGVDQYYNSGTRLPDGSRMHVNVEFTDDAALAHLNVTVRPGGKGPMDRANQNNWYVDTPPTTHAHELGHQMGLLDEYVDPTAVNRYTHGRPGVHDDDSLMGNYWTADANGNPVPAAGTHVKPRHTQQIQDDIDAAGPLAQKPPPTNSGSSHAPAPGPREDYRAAESRRRAEQSVKDNDLLDPNDPSKGGFGHGHGRHGHQTTDAQQAERIRSGQTPDGHHSQPDSATGFRSAEAEAEAVGRARNALDKDLASGTNPLLQWRARPNSTSGEMGYWSNSGNPREMVYKPTTDDPRGFGSTTWEAKKDAAGNYDLDAAGDRIPVPNTTPVVRAQVVFRWVPSIQEWRSYTYYPKN